MTGRQRQVVIVGLAGGVGSGKSTVARLLAEHGARVIDSDRLNGEELGTADVVDTLVGWYGPAIRGLDGSLRREALAEIIFRDPQQRARVEGLLHPRIARRRGELIEQYRRDPNVRMIVLDSPLLYETGLNRLCDVIVFVDAPLEQRQQCVAESRGWSAGELARRENLQKPLDSKRSGADHIVVNHSGLDDLRSRVEKLLSDLLA